MFARTLFALLISVAPLSISTAADCKASLKEVGPAAMNAPFDQFDQDETVGWRILQNRGCFAEAAQLIEYYSVDVDSRYRQLKWHLAQMHASAGNSEKALVAAQLSLSPVQEEMHPDFDWNDYVLATVAFLRRDRAAFDKHRSALNQAAQKNQVNVSNRNVLERLAKCYEKPYVDAYACTAP